MIYFISRRIIRLFANAGSEFGWRIFQNLLDPVDDRPFDLKDAERSMDQLAALIQQGKNSEALRLCTVLEKSSSVSRQALETLVYRLYQEQLDSKSPFLSDIRRWREQKDFVKAESELQQLLTRQPDNWAATLLLARLYAEDMGQPNRALALIQPTKKRSPLPPQFLSLARQSITEWSEAASNREQMERSSEQGSLHGESEPAARKISIDELLNTGQLVTAIEHLENALKEQPEDAGLWLKLAEVYAVYCFDEAKSAKVIRQMAAAGKFTVEVMDSARAKLREWQSVRP